MTPRKDLAESVESRLKELDFDGAAVNMRSILAAERVLPGPYEKLLKIMASILKKEPSARVFALKGKALSNLARYGEARRALERSLSLDGGQALPRAWLGGVRLLEGQVVKAASELDRALALDPLCAWAYFYRAASRYIMGDEAAARADLARILKLAARDGSDLAARAFLSLLETKADRFKAALEVLEPVVESRSREGWPYVLRAAVHRAQGVKGAALKDLGRALKRISADWIYLERAGLHAELGNAKAALRDMESALRLSAKPALFLRRAEIHAGAGRYDLAMRDFDRSLPSGSAGADARGFALELSQGLARRGLKDKALKILRRAARSYPNDDEIVAATARLLEESGLAKKAESLLRETRRRRPRSESVVALLSDLLENSDRGDEAVDLLRRDAAKSAVSGVRLAQILLRRGRPGDAEEALSAALERAPRNAEAWRMLGRVRASQGRLRESYAAHRKALDFAPQSLESSFFLAEMLLRLGRPDKARALLAPARRALRSSAGIEGLMDRFDAAILCLDFDEAADAGEKILDATRSFGCLNRMSRPFFRDEFDFIALPSGYKRKAFAALDEHLARRPGSPWGRYYRSLLTDMLGVGKPASADIAKINSLPRSRYGWMRGHIGEVELITHRNFPAARAALAAAARACEPGDWAAQCMLAEVLLCQGDAAACRRAFDAAEKMAPAAEWGEVSAWRGEVLLWSGDYAKALKALDAAIAGRHSRFAQGWRGGALVKLGRYDEALAALERATAMVPHDGEARTWRVEALYRLGRFREACEEADFSASHYERYCGFHLHVLRGLSRGALGDVVGMRADFGRVPRDITEYAAQSLRIAPASAADAKRLLEAILDLSRGVRRGGYENSVWMR